MSIDVTAERVIPLRRNAWPTTPWTGTTTRVWTQGIREANLTREADHGGFGVGAEVTRTAHFLGKRIDYVLRVAAHEPSALLDMVSVAGPMPVHVTYSFAPDPRGTLARIRVRGDAGGLYRLAAPLMAGKVRSSITKDLRDLERALGV